MSIRRAKVRLAFYCSIEDCYGPRHNSFRSASFRIDARAKVIICIFFCAHGAAVHDGAIGTTKHETRNLGATYTTTGYQCLCLVRCSLDGFMRDFTSYSGIDVDRHASEHSCEFSSLSRTSSECRTWRPNSKGRNSNFMTQPKRLYWMHATYGHKHKTKTSQKCPFFCRSMGFATCHYFISPWTTLLHNRNDRLSTRNSAQKKSLALPIKISLLLSLPFSC